MLAPMIAAATENIMAAQIIPLKGAENSETPAPPRPPIHNGARASLTDAGRRLWAFARLWAEGLGWLVIVASIIAAVF